MQPLLVVLTSINTGLRNFVVYFTHMYLTAKKKIERSIHLNKPDTPELNRSLTLPLVVFYGLGTTIGAGIYVLIGATAARAGLYAPVAFVISALVMVPSAVFVWRGCGATSF